MVNKDESSKENAGPAPNIEHRSSNLQPKLPRIAMSKFLIIRCLKFPCAPRSTFIDDCCTKLNIEMFYIQKMPIVYVSDVDDAQPIIVYHIIDCIMD